MSKSIADRIEEANKKAIANMLSSEPVWTDIRPAIEVVEGMKENMILHSGPPISWGDMTDLHKNAVISGMLYEGLAKDKTEAISRIENGEIAIESALDHNVVGAGVGVVTPSICLVVIEEKASGKNAYAFPAEGAFRGGLCGWGRYSEEIGENLHMMRRDIFPHIVKLLKKKEGMFLKPIIAQGLQMGDENHTRQVAAGAILIKELVPDLCRLDIDKNTLISTTAQG